MTFLLTILLCVSLAGGFAFAVLCTFVWWWVYHGEGKELIRTFKESRR